MIEKIIFNNLKAWIGFLVAFLGALQVGMNGGLSGEEAVGAVVTGLVALGGVYGIANSGVVSADKAVDAVLAGAHMAGNKVAETLTTTSVGASGEVTKMAEGVVSAVASDTLSNVIKQTGLVSAHKK